MSQDSVRATSVDELVSERAAWLWTVGGFLAALLLWWPFSYSGRAQLFTMPAGPSQVGVVLAGAFAASGVTALLIRPRWPRWLIVIALPLMCLSHTGDATSRSWVVLLALLVVVVLGAAVGSVGADTPTAAAFTMALLVGVAPGALWKGPLVALALMLPFVRASRARVMPTMVAVVGVVGLWLFGAVLGQALESGFATGGRTEGTALISDGLAGSIRAAGAGGRGVVDSTLSDSAGWFVVAAVLAVLVALVRAIWPGPRVQDWALGGIIAMRRRRTAAGGRGSPTGTRGPKR